MKVQGENRVDSVALNRRGRVRKGMSIMDSAPKAAKDYSRDLWNRGFAKSAICNLLTRDYGITIESTTLGKWLDKECEFKFAPGTESFKEEASKEFANVFDGLYKVQHALMKKFDQAIIDDECDKIAVYSKLINDNVQTAHKILNDLGKNDKPREDIKTESFAQLLERSAKKRHEAIIITQEP